LVFLGKALNERLGTHVDLLLPPLVGASCSYTRRQVLNQGQHLPNKSRRRRACLINRQAR
jgi:hypothetical protein